MDWLLSQSPAQDPEITRSGKLIQGDIQPVTDHLDCDDSCILAVSLHNILER